MSARPLAFDPKGCVECTESEDEVVLFCEQTAPVDVKQAEEYVAVYFVGQPQSRRLTLHPSLMKPPMTCFWFCSEGLDLTAG
eukprot:2573484-Amphidinium_carterae.1